MIDKSELINHYFKLALKDIDNGVSIDELRSLMFEFEKQEMYEACAGIHKAIDFNRFWQLMDEIDDKSYLDKIQINFETDGSNT